MALELLTNMRPGGTSLGPLPRHLLRTPAACIPQEVQAMGMCPGASAGFLTFPVPIPLACVSPSTVSPEHWAGAVMMKATGSPVPLSRCWGRKIQVQTQAKSSSRERVRKTKPPWEGMPGAVPMGLGQDGGHSCRGTWTPGPWTFQPKWGLVFMAVSLTWISKSHL